MVNAGTSNPDARGVQLPSSPMTAPLKPFYTLFSFTLLLGVVVVLSSNNWITIWAGLELNIYSFVPLLLTSKSNQEKEAAIKYFLFQALASGLLLIRALTSHLLGVGPMFLLIRILIKLGIAPCHFWFPIVINRIRWNICWVLSTIQKISPIILILSSLSNKIIEPVAYISGANALLGGLIGLNQTQLRPILAYSSIGHIGWISRGILCSTHLSWWYFIVYLFLISTIIPIFASLRMTSNKISLRSINAPQNNDVILVIALLRLGGIPPILGFFPKIFIISSLVSNNMISLALILIIGSTLNLYYYIKIAFNIFLNSYSTQPFLMLHTLPPRIFIISWVLSISTFTGILMLPLTII